MIQNRLCQTLGIERPLLLAPMGGAVDAKFAAQFSALGGLGNMPLWRASGDAIVAAAAAVRDVTDRPFAVNLNISFLQQEQIAACVSAEVPVVSLFWGFSAKAIEQAKAGGATVIYSVGSAQEARDAVSAGADVICAQGWEAGGHVWGDISTLALVPAVVDAVGDVPVVAAGGIADRRGVAAAFALGAQGVWVGTRFLGAEELAIHAHYRARILQAEDDATMHSVDLFDGTWPDAPHRALKNSTYDNWASAGSPQPGARPDEGKVIGTKANGAAVMMYESATPGPGHSGDIEAMSMWAGQGVGLVSKTEPLADIMDDLQHGVPG